MKEVVKQNVPNVSMRYYYPLFGDYREFACGWAAAMVNITLTFPVNKLIFRQMLHGCSVRMAFMQMVDEGLVSLYRGILPPLLQKSVSSSLMFGTYDMFRKPLIENTTMPTALSNAIGAMLAGTVEASLTPFERIQTLLQDTAYAHRFANTTDVARVIRERYGFAEYYRGLVPILFRNGPSNVVFFLARDYLDHITTHFANAFVGAYVVKQFLIGACIGAFNSTLFYPLSVVKVHMQSRLGGPFQRIDRAFVELYNERGRNIRFFYKGVHMNYTRSFISWGIINVAYDRIKILLPIEDNSYDK